MYDETQDSLSLDEWEEEQDRGLATAKYIPIAPYFSPTQGYLNFEVAIEKSDSGKTQHLAAAHRNNHTWIASTQTEWCASSPPLTSLPPLKSII